MATVYARTEFRKNIGAHSRVQFQTYDITEATTIQGGADGVWDITTVAQAYTVTVNNYDRSHFADYVTPPNKPYIIIKCSADCSVENATIKDEAGNTLFTFAANYSVTPGYVVLTLDSPTTGDFTWKIA